MYLKDHDYSYRYFLYINIFFLNFLFSFTLQFILIWYNLRISIQKGLRGGNWIGSGGCILKLHLHCTFMTEKHATVQIMDSGG